MEELSGGRESAIYRDGEVVYRPLQSWSSTIHLILKHLEQAKDNPLSSINFIQDKLFDLNVEWCRHNDSLLFDYTNTA